MAESAGSTSELAPRDPRSPHSDGARGRARAASTSADPVADEFKIGEPGTGPYANFGAATDIDGDTAVVGAPREEGIGGTPAFESGVVHLFTQARPGVWKLGATLIAPDAGAGDDFGSAVAISGDTVVVAAPQWEPDHEPFWFNSGSVYVFVREGATWRLQSQLTSPMPVESASFGMAVAIDGDTIVASQPTTPAGHGKVHVYRRHHGQWTLRATISRPDDDAFAFGSSLDLDGQRLVIAAPGVSGDDPGSGPSAYVLVGSDTTWRVDGRLTPPKNGIESWFGFDVAISGETVVVGGPTTGEAHVFEGAGAWDHTATLNGNGDGSSGFHSDSFGWSVSIDDGLIAVGAPTGGPDGIGERPSGSTYLFSRDLGWGQLGILTAAETEATRYLGVAVDVTGNTVIAGAPTNLLTWFQDTIDGHRGSAHIFAITTPDM